jgi:hypothetical protein
MEKATQLTVRSIAVGNLLNADTARNLLSGIKISKSADKLLGNVSFKKDESRLDLVFVTVADLGLSNRATTIDIYGAASRQGFSLCHPEVAPQIRLQCPDLRKWMLIAMQPMTDSKGRPVIFFLPTWADEGVCLSTSYGDLEHRWDHDRMWVFTSGGGVLP